MTRRRPGSSGTVVASALLIAVVAACGSSSAGSADSAPTSRAANSVSGPSVSARMICSEDEIENTITIDAGLHEHPSRASSWDPPVFRCTYTLPDGPLVLTVTEFGSDAAARRSFDQRKSAFVSDKTPVQTLDALGVPAFLAADDVVESVKDNHVLRVDATALPASVGPAHRDRRDLSYLVARAILQCWTGA